MWKSSFLILAATLLPHFAHASGFAAGDFVEFLHSSPAFSAEQSYSIHVHEVRSENSFGIVQSWSQANRPPLRSWLSEEQLEASLIGFSREHTQKYFSNCSEYGKLEVVSAPAGSFLACTIFFLDDSKNSYSISPAVPLGIVRRVSGPDENGAYHEFILRSFDFGDRHD